MRVLTMAVAVLAFAGTAAAQTDAEKKAVVQVITDAYINGVHAKPDPDAMRRGFHPDFRMLVLTDGKMTAVTLDEWAGRVAKGAANANAPKPAIKADFPQVDVTGTVASARVEVYRDGKHAFTDQLLLYKFADGWKIVSKAYYTHPR
jgi:ketosteroid isomerase-like protein